MDGLRPNIVLLTDATLRARTLLYLSLGAVVLGVLAYGLTSPVPMEDATSMPEYKNVIGKRLRSEKDVLAISVTSDRNYKKQVDYVVLAALPGFSGPEVVSTEKVAKGTELRIVGIRRSSVPLLNRIDYLVEMAGKAKGVPIYLRVSGRPTDPNLGLEPAHYAELR